MGWVARAWTSVFPPSNSSFQLLSMTNSAIALWTVDLIARRFVQGDKRIVVLLLVMLLPTYQFHAQRFNANAILLALWPLATYCFLRSFETQQWPWALAAGATAALAMLGKYYSVFLIGSFAFAALCHPQRRLYFKSSAPGVAAAAGLAVLAPHLYWLATTGAMPFGYAMAAHAGRNLDSSLNEALFFVLGLAATMALPAVIWVMIAGYRLKSFAHDFRTMNSGLLLLFFVSIGTIILPIVTAVALGTDLPPLWASQGLFLFGVLIVCGASYSIERFYSVNLTVIVIGIAVVATVVAAPIHAVYRNSNPFLEGRNYYRPASLELTRQWHEQTDVPLPAVGGDETLALAAAFYSPDHPISGNPYIYEHSRDGTRQNLKKGWAAMCFNGDVACIDGIDRVASQASHAIRSEVEVRSMLLGCPGAARRITTLIVPPSKEESGQ